MQNLFRIGLLVTYMAFAFLLKERSSFLLFITIYAVLFFFYTQVIRKNNDSLLINSLWLVLMSFPLFWVNPVLSDDVYRFIWDGRLSISGINPYKYLPSEITNPELTQLFSKLNSPDYYSVYPPLKQVIFATAAFLSGTSIATNIFIFRALLLLAVVFSGYLIRETIRLSNFNEVGTRNKHLWLLYNPLVLLESVGNMHFEILMLTFLLASYYGYLKRKKIFLPSILFGMAVSVKLIPLMLLPLIVIKLGFRKGVLFVIIAFLLNVGLLLPFLDMATILNFSQSLDLYFHSFEFNASLYYLIRELGYLFTGFNIINYTGTLLGIISFISILWLAYSGKYFSLTVVLTLFIHLIFSTTVHPWYIIPLIGVAALTPYRFPYLWSMSIGLSYHAYSNLPVQENLWITLLAYLPVLGLALVEIANNDNYRPKHLRGLHF